MPEFGKKSQAVLDTVDPRLQEVLERIIPHYDFSVLSGFRDKVEQDEIFRQGRSKKQWPNSKHNKNADGKTQLFSVAVDLAPYPIDWDDEPSFLYLAGMVMQQAADLGYEVRWGGDWDQDDEILSDQTFQDLGHFELVI